MSQSMLKWKQAESSLYSFFGGKQSPDGKEINKASETPASTKKTCKYQEAWIGTNHFQTDSLKAHKASEAHNVRHLFWQPCMDK